MKLRLLSDVHLEFGKLRATQGDEDVVVLAGDIGVGCEDFDYMIANDMETGRPEAR